ncbi:MAG: hypothetical protein IJW37_09555 [Lachnospiraceae bacterium]|nr:hypothetical protein [Lachnospiraceae bacterium]
MKLGKKIAAALLGVATMLSICPTGVAHATEVNTYTYNYDFWGIEYESPDAYKPTTFITGESLGTTEFKAPQGLYVRGDKMYIVDTGNSRILEVQVQGAEITLLREIKEFKGDAEVTTFNLPQDIFVTAEGEFFIADTENQRIVHLDQDLNLIKLITQPTDDPTVDQSLSFLPTKVVADRAGRAFVLVKSVNKGFMEFEANGEFIAYVGANEVVFNMVDYIKKVFSTKAQRAQMESFTPTEYNNLYIDGSGFVYCTTSVFEEASLKTDAAKPIRKLNSLGKDILIKNAEYPPIGDLQWDNVAGMDGPSRLIDVTAFDNEMYYAVDRVRGRIFGYDEQGNLLYAFGGPGNKLGYFQNPVAIDHMDTDLFVLDSSSGGLTRFELTEYGQLIYNGLEQYDIGEYEKSAEYWKEVLKLNGNYDLAYIGIGRALLGQGEYEEAMEYFEVKRDDDNYSRAWKYYRKEWIEENLGYVIVVLAVLILIPSVIKTVKKIKKEAREEYEFQIELVRRDQQI